MDVLLDQLHSPGLCDHPPGLLRVEPHTLSHIVPEGEGEIVKYSGTINKEPSEKGIIKDSASVPEISYSKDKPLYRIKCRKHNIHSTKNL